MKFCSGCGTPLNNESRFCPGCGKSTVQVNPQPAQEQKNINQEQDSIKQEQKSIKQEQRSIEQVQISINQEQKNTKQEQRSIEQEQKNIEQVRKNIKQEQKNIEQVQKNIKQEQKSINQEQKSINQEQKSIKQEQNSIKQKQKNIKADKTKAPMRAAAQLLTSTTLASATAGEISLSIPVNNTGGIMNAIGPLKCLFGGIANIFRGFRTALKDKKRWIPVTIMALLWMGLTLLPALGLNLSSLKWLSWLTFANGGTTGSIAAGIGGVAGKGIFAYFITTIITSIASKKNPFKGIFSGLKSIFSSFSIKNISSVALLLFGLGAALIAYNFLTGTNSLQLSMVGVTSFFIMLRSISSRTSFMRRFISSLITKKGKPINTTSVTRVMSGWALGFALGIALSALPLANLGYFTGGGLLVISFVFGIVGLRKKEVAVK